MYVYKIVNDVFIAACYELLYGGPGFNSLVMLIAYFLKKIH